MKVLIMIISSMVFPILASGMTLGNWINFFEEVEKKEGQSVKKYFKVVQEGSANGFRVFYYDPQNSKSCSVLYTIQANIDYKTGSYQGNPKISGPSNLICKDSKMKKKPLSIQEIISLIKKVSIMKPNDIYPSNSPNPCIVLMTAFKSKDEKNATAVIGVMDEKAKITNWCDMDFYEGKPEFCTGPDYND